MEYPIYIDGKERGRLQVSQEGLRTRFEAICEPAQGIIRLSVYGGGERAYLGVLCPQSGELYLCRSFSKNEMRCFPQKIEYAANAELSQEVNEDTEWIMSTNGCLISQQKDCKLVAVPAAPERIGKKVKMREINGRYYLVFHK